MVKGCKKNIVYLKNTGSAAFSEAFFIIDDPAPTMSKRELIREANRIAEQGLGYKHRRTKRQKTLGVVWSVAMLLLGVILSSILWIILT